MEWASRKELGWHMSNTAEAKFCVAPLANALACLGEASNLTPIRAASHQHRLHQRLPDPEVQVSHGWAWPRMDEVFCEQLWRSLTYECVHLNAFD